ncbi:Scr1 family TA system antitoxin-like transcriptional regulator [Streptomyces mirabilis]|uniref:Scr1 family TA system antitoxin-like transcriptional regulator n=1 Tax=Streptomyces mirabilis TaxID=68239 RepID=UPI0036F36E5A
MPRLDTVQLDSAHGPEFTHAEAQLTKYRAHLDWMDGAAMTSAASRDLIQQIAHEL